MKGRIRMSLAVFLAVLAAAAMHASWNAMVKVHLDRFLSVTVLTLGMASMALLAVPFVEFPKAEVWPWILASTMFHMGYKLCLIGAYKAGDLAQTYPLARGTAPLLAAIGGIFVVSEVPGPLSIIGILLLCAGTLVMSFRGGGHLEKLNLHAVGYALATSVFIASYTLSDGSGARLAASASSYAVHLFLADGIWSLILCLAVRGPQSLPDRDVGDDQGADRHRGVPARKLDPVRHADLRLRARRKDDGVAQCGGTWHCRRRRGFETGLSVAKASFAKRDGMPMTSVAVSLRQTPDRTPSGRPCHLRVPRPDARRLVCAPRAPDRRRERSHR